MPPEALGCEQGEIVPVLAPPGRIRDGPVHFHVVLLPLLPDALPGAVTCGGGRGLFVPRAGLEEGHEPEVLVSRCMYQQLLICGRVKSTEINNTSMHAFTSLPAERIAHKEEMLPLKALDRLGMPLLKVGNTHIIDLD